MANALDQSRKMERFETLESNVRSYSRSFPAIFCRARGSIMLTEDFFFGAGALNYDHNNHPSVALPLAVTGRQGAK
ncbi:hypothetical protein [Bradyrhizobium barranii]|uniref:hypothetical protein n=1 Tax=Bradyrhizobium barranii TaxID=2992140 RepID=UPI003D15F60C